HAVRTDENRIADHVCAEADLSADEIVEDDVPGAVGHTKADDSFLAAVDATPGFVASDVAAPADVFRGTSGGQRRLAIGFELVCRTETVIRGARRQEFHCIGAIYMQPFG